MNATPRTEPRHDDGTCAPEMGQVAQLVLDNLPLGVLVIDRTGVIRMANGRARQMSGLVTKSIGRSILDFVDPADHAFMAANIARGSDLPDRVLGPLQLRYVDRHGNSHLSEHWGFEAPAELGIDGYIVTMSHPSVADHLAAAVRAIAAGDALDVTLPAITAAFAAYPLVALGSMLVADDDNEVVEVIGTWPVEDRRQTGGCDAPWVEVLRGGPDRDVLVDDLSGPLSARARSVGLAAVWLRAVDVDGHRRAVLAAWRTHDPAPTPNQERHLGEAVALASLAFGQHDHRARLRKEASYDPLTGIGNRTLLQQRFDSHADRVAGVLYIDLDGFKSVNDRYGHSVGDLVLKATAARLARLLRRDDVVCRVGGDEFVVMLAEQPGASPCDPEAVAARIVSALAEPFEIDATVTTLSASVGVATTGEQIDLDELLRRSDGALLTAKRAGKARWHLAPTATAC